MKRGNPVGPVGVHSADTIEYADREFCDPVNVEIGDGRPGILAAEWEVTTTGTEPQLRHTDNVVLGATHWPVTAPGCSIDRSPTHPRGSVLTAQVPATPQPSGSQGVAE